MKIKLYYKEGIAIIGLFALCIVLMTGCGQKKDKNGSLMSDDGRSYGGLIQADMKDTVSTAFFDVTVDEAVKYDTFQFSDGLYQAEEGKTYLLVTLTIKNTYAENLSMSITDFVLNYDGNESTEIITGYGKAEMNKEEYMENLFTLKQDESVTKTILFTVADKEQYTINYTEYYEDQFEGNTFQIEVEPEIKSAVTEMTTEASAEEQQGEASTEAVSEEQQASAPADTEAEE